MGSGKIVTYEEFLRRAKEAHEDFDNYEYDKSSFIKTQVNMRIFCKKHNQWFEQTPGRHMKGAGCPICGKEKAANFWHSKALTFNDFIERSKKSHPDDFDNYIYDESSFSKMSSPIRIFCKNHGGWFIQNAGAHSRGQGCLTCVGDRLSKIVTKPFSYFLERAKKAHPGEEYEYDESSYINMTTPMRIFCKVHNEWFLQKPIVHVTGFFSNKYNRYFDPCGCPKCGKLSAINKTRIKFEDFKKRAINKYGDKYEYDENSFKGMAIKMKMFCHRCNQYFWQKPNDHLYGHQCPNCRFSRMEAAGKHWFDKNNINYETQKWFSDCKDKAVLPFDGYLPDYKILIEYQGQQHYKYIEHFMGGDWTIESFETLQKHDKIKKDWCLANNYKLIEIRYDENVEERLNEEILPIVNSSG